VSFWDRLAAVRTEWDVLGHPFYVRWSQGELSREELAAYAAQYRYAVAALAEASAVAAARAEGPLRAHLEAHAAEESEHVALWDRFVEAAGGDAAAAPTPETRACATAWAGAERPVLATLAALYAIEAAQPQIAEVKRRGLVELYGFGPGPATDYFDVHATLDHEHAAAHRAWLDASLEGADEDELVAAGRDVLAANWRLLDGVSG
jgi:pyrroloquinoline-quinone synthase